jgi:hypothetical protein
MGALQSAVLHPESEMRARIPPEMSNYYCHPGKAGGSPLDLVFADEPGGLSEVWEGMLAHVVGAMEGAYRRSDALEKRRALLAARAVHIESGTAAANAIPVFTASR